MVYHRINPNQKERALYLHLEEGWGSSTCCCSWGIAQSIECIERWEANSSKSTHSYTHFGSFDAANGAALSEPFRLVPGIRSGERSCMRGKMRKSELRLHVLGADRLRDRLEYSSVSYKGNQYYQSETKDLRVNHEENMKTTPNSSTGKTAERSQKSQRFGWTMGSLGEIYVPDVLNHYKHSQHCVPLASLALQDLHLTVTATAFRIGESRMLGH
ncbi:hypothetical protein EDB19DRAFT_2022156 [Suillus lakei]|nr:hypothetical protein EDB19DRAFT_2022156 [Suillus lakei]